MKTDDQKSGKILRIKQLMALTGLSRSTIYNKLDEGSRYYDPDFPKQIPLGASIVGWLEEEVNAWVELCASRRLILPSNRGHGFKQRLGTQNSPDS
jgi:prophage regulatory protein